MEYSKFKYEQFFNFYSDWCAINGSEKLPKLVIYRKITDKSKPNDYKWESRTVQPKALHPVLSDVFIDVSPESRYVYFYRPQKHNDDNDILYGDHFSIGNKGMNSKVKSNLIDIHYTKENHLSKKSENEPFKCFLHEGFNTPIVDLRSFAQMQCVIPRSGPNIRFIGNTFNDPKMLDMLDVLFSIINTPFIKGWQTGGHVIIVHGVGKKKVKFDGKRFYVSIHGCKVALQDMKNTTI